MATLAVTRRLDLTDEQWARGWNRCRLCPRGRVGRRRGRNGSSSTGSDGGCGSVRPGGTSRTATAPGGRCMRCSGRSPASDGSADRPPVNTATISSAESAGRGALTVRRETATVPTRLVRQGDQNSAPRNDVITDDARDAARFARQIRESGPSSSALEHLASEVGRHAADFISRSVSELIVDIRELVPPGPDSTSSAATKVCIEKRSHRPLRADTIRVAQSIVPPLTLVAAAIRPRSSRPPASPRGPPSLFARLEDRCRP